MGDQSIPPSQLDDPAKPPPPPASSGPADYRPPAYLSDYPQPIPQASSSSGGRRALLIIIAVILLLCCCGTAAAGVWMWQRGTFDDVIDAGSSSGDMTRTDGGRIGTPGVVAAWLSWNGAVDIDLEVYDASGTTYLGSAYNWSGDDIKNGSEGDEYMEFATYSDRDFSGGEYTLVAYYFDSADKTYPSTTVELTIQDVDGGVQTFAKTIEYDSSSDQWYAVRIDAATGSVTAIDRLD